MLIWMRFTRLLRRGGTPRRCTGGHWCVLVATALPPCLSPLPFPLSHLLARRLQVVVQYNPFGDLRDLRPHDHRCMPHSNGSIIAVSYPARKFGVKRYGAGWRRGIDCGQHFRASSGKTHCAALCSLHMFQSYCNTMHSNMMAQEAVKLCPDLVIIQVPVAHGKVRQC